MDIIAKDAVSMLCREMVDGHVCYVRRPLPALTADSDFMDIFKAEAEKLENITVATQMRYDCWRDGVWVMKLAPGFISLFEALTRRPAAVCSPEVVTSIARSVVEHLDYLHRHGFWMVQLSPHNVMVNITTRQVRVLPPLSPYLDLRHNVFANQQGVAPEAINNEGITAQSDFYGLAHLLSKFQQFSPLPRSLSIIQAECSNELLAQRIGNTTEMMRILDRADKGNKAMPYLIGAACFAVLFAMFVFVGGDEEVPNPDARYIPPEKHEPSAEGVPDTVNILIEQYNRFLKDSMDIEDDDFLEDIEYEDL